ncbi:hypothetical protein V3I05_04865 [Helicobacter mastomyrinus]|uniref:Uncharacterized protein n=1 Tax=Helicobacter mastomyrinus TaxID=287948 RepID=A0ABZ3F9E7_9HELI
MINIRNLLASQANELKHKENLKKQRAFQSSPLQSISPKENEKLIKIDKFIFILKALIMSSILALQR